MKFSPPTREAIERDPGFWRRLRQIAPRHPLLNGGEWFADGPIEPYFGEESPSEPPSSNAVPAAAQAGLPAAGKLVHDPQPPAEPGRPDAAVHGLPMPSETKTDPIEALQKFIHESEGFKDLAPERQAVFRSELRRQLRGERIARFFRTKSLDELNGGERTISY